MLIDDIGLWLQVGPAELHGRPALFLDRDGVIVADTGYLGRAEDIHLLDGAADAIARCNRAGIPVVVVTNQSGIARGYYGWDDFRAVQAALSLALAAAGAHLDAVLACAYHAEGAVPYRVAGHPWRKPNAGMILAAADRMNIDLPPSWIVGNETSDLAAGAAAALAGGMLIGSKERARHAAAAIADGRFVIEAASSLGDAVTVLISRLKGRR